MSEGETIRQAREEFYGPFLEHWTATAKAWDGLVGRIQSRGENPYIMPSDVGLFFALDKIMREVYRHKQDNVDDAINYITMSAEIGGEE